jgi:hypothetical protein
MKVEEFLINWTVLPRTTSVICENVSLIECWMTRQALEEHAPARECVFVACFFRVQHAGKEEVDSQSSVDQLLGAVLDRSGGRAS